MCCTWGHTVYMQVRTHIRTQTRASTHAHVHGLHPSQLGCWAHLLEDGSAAPLQLCHSSPLLSSRLRAPPATTVCACVHACVCCVKESAVMALEERGCSGQGEVEVACRVGLWHTYVQIGEVCDELRKQLAALLPFKKCTHTHWAPFRSPRTIQVPSCPHGS